jgi:hypothetical protein
MSVIFPGNYVAHLNAYRDQGVAALPGVEFYQLRGLAYVTEDQTGGGTLTLEIPSPDLRQDDKPRLDKPFVLPADGCTVYRTAINVQNLEASGTDTVSVSGLSTTSGTQASLAAADGVFDEAGASTVFDGFNTMSAETGSVTISAAYSGALTIVNPDDQAIVMVEVCFFVDAPGPEADDYNLSYKVEAGQGY